MNIYSDILAEAITFANDKVLLFYVYMSLESYEDTNNMNTFIRYEEYYL